METNNGRILTVREVTVEPIVRVERFVSADKRYFAFDHWWDMHGHLSSVSEIGESAAQTLHE